MNYRPTQNRSQQVWEDSLPLDYTHNALLVLASFAIALMAGFTGLSMIRGASQLDEAARKARIAASAIVLGGGIWSMHFVAMLGLQLPVPFFYDALTTLISALIAILIVGLGLILLHFRERTPVTITLAGLTFGVGILGMHYVGMAGMEACRATYSIGGIITSVGTSLVLSTVAIWVAYTERTRTNILLGTLCFAIAVVALHFIAISGTTFIEVATSATARIPLSNEMLALVVTLASFALCGGFLLSGATFFPSTAPTVEPASPPSVEVASMATEDVPESATASHACPIPFEKDNRTHFVDAAEVAAFRAEGHYTIIYLKGEKAFCPWSISEAAKRLDRTAFIQAHRSYLINPNLVSGFERKKDTGLVYFDQFDSIEKVPVSRSRLPEVRAALGI